MGEAVGDQEPSLNKGVRDCNYHSERHLSRQLYHLTIWGEGVVTPVMILMLNSIHTKNNEHNQEFSRIVL